MQWYPVSLAPLNPTVVRCSRLWTRSLIDAELDALVACFEGIARVSYQKGMSIISLICNVERTSEILERVRCRSRCAAGLLCPVRRPCHGPMAYARHMT